jgi:PAT family beta-lactamase induction signal transducer AmpG
MNQKEYKNAQPWLWVPSLYFTEGIPYVVVMVISVVMYKNLGISNADIAFYTSWLYLPWVIKPIWSPLVDIFKTKRFWFIGMQFIMGVALACVAFTIPTNHFFQLTLAFFWLMAFSSATHDIAADGFYMIALRESEQAFFLGIRSTAYRLAMITGQGLVVILAGQLILYYDDAATAWSITFVVLAVLMLGLFLYHSFTTPNNLEEPTTVQLKDFFKEFFLTFIHFFKKKDILLIIAFLLTYRFGEAQLIKLAQPFMLDPIEKGGLALSNTMVGTLYGTFGIIALVIGGLLGGWLVSLHGLKAWLWAMIFAINLPNFLYAFLAAYQPDSWLVTGGVIMLEQFGYGFGFTAYLMFMIYAAQGRFKTAHYALSTGFMALGMMIPGMFSGAIQEALGYTSFFVWVGLCALPGMLVVYFINIPPDFGKK